MRDSHATRGGCRKCGSGSHTEQTNKEMVGNGGSRHQQHRMNPVLPSCPVGMCPCRFRNGGMGPHVRSCVVVEEAREQQIYCSTAQRTTRWAGGFERRHLESKLKPAMQDAELEVAWVVLRRRNASTKLPVRVRSSDMVPGCWKPVRRRLVVDLDARAWPLGAFGTYDCGGFRGLFPCSYRKTALFRRKNCQNSGAGFQPQVGCCFI